jgi:hypothetical protein
VTGAGRPYSSSWTHPGDGATTTRRPAGRVLLNGRYRLDAGIAAGGMATVYRAPT